MRSVLKRRRGLAWRTSAVLAAIAALVLIPTTSASAHPLGNFTINHYHGLVLSPDRIIDHAVIDSAELPTLQEQDKVDVNHDGTASAVERAGFAAATCQRLATDVVASVNGTTVSWTVNASTLSYAEGAAGLDTSRLECTLGAPVDLGLTADVDFDDQYLADRLGWREITAVGEGLALADPDVPTTSVSNQLRDYPNGLLASPLDQRSVHLDTAPGRSVDEGVAPTVAEPGWTSRLLGSATDQLDNLVGSRDLTLKVGLLAVALCLLLGASHAALPGHGKALMAAYMVGTRGTPRDAVWIGTTVTLAHTTGVLVLGALFSASATFAGESLLAGLGVVSGLMVAGIGVVLVRSALRGRSILEVGHGHGHTHGHGHGQGHGHGHTHDDGVGHGHSHDAPSHDEEDRAVFHSAVGQPEGALMVGRGVAVQTRVAAPPVEVAPREAKGFRRWTLVGMGIAGGLVPSPSALIVLLGAVALGRTAFGVLLVLAYGIGMAVTLTAVGYVFAKVPRGTGWLRSAADRPGFARLSALAPVLTASLVLLVGLGLALRSAGPLL